MKGSKCSDTACHKPSHPTEEQINSKAILQHKQISSSLARIRSQSFAIRKSVECELVLPPMVVHVGLGVSEYAAVWIKSFSNCNANGSRNRIRIRVEGQTVSPTIVIEVFVRLLDHTTRGLLCHANNIANSARDLDFETTEREQMPPSILVEILSRMDLGHYTMRIKCLSKHNSDS